MTYLSQERLEQIKAFAETTDNSNAEMIKAKAYMRDLLDTISNILDHYTRDLDMTEQHGWGSVQNGEYADEVRGRQKHYEARLNLINGLSNGR